MKRRQPRPRVSTNSLLNATIAVLALSSTCEARDIVVESNAVDATAISLASSHSIQAVREAIADCQNGNYQKAVPVLKEYATKRDVGATYVLACLYLNGEGAEASEEEAVKLFNNNIAGGHTPSMVRLAAFKEATSSAESLQLYKRASADNSVIAHLRLGRIFENGELGTRANPKLAFKYYDKAHQQNHALGTFHVARCHDEGVGVSPNAIEATRLYRQAAMSGAGLANAVMARRYFEGIGVEPDPVAAVGWLLRGSQAGSTDAMVLLGQRYEAGDVIGRDLNQAGQLFSAAAKRNDPVGRYCLAMMYLNGTGTTKDPVRAYVLLNGASSLPKANSLLEKLETELTTEQLKLAREKINSATSE